MASYHSLLLLFLQLTMLIICLCGISLAGALNNGFSVELIHRDSEESPFYNPTETPFQQMTNSFDRSFNSLNRFYPQAKVSPKAAQSEVISVQGEYLVKYSIGTPPFQIIGQFDTASDLIWSQCKPCEFCFKQTNPIFDSSKSRTYKTVHCSSRLCQSFDLNVCDSNAGSKQHCEYDILYADGSYSNGNLAVDTLTLGSTTGRPISFPKITFGCGFNNSLTFVTKGSGIVGLGRGKSSFISQIGHSIDFKFSYCLVPFFESKSTSTLNFGGNAVVFGSGTVSTPLASGDSPSFYYLTLMGMSVGPRRLDLLTVSTATGNKKGNIIITTGTTLTLLPEKFYFKLEAEVAAQIKLKRVQSADPSLNLCYMSPPNTIKPPIITAHFPGANVRLDSFNTFVSVSEDVVCFAFAPVSDGAIFGSLAQMNFLIGYDLLKNTVSFRRAACSKM
ncbi:aspartic proteinase CDR1-like [Gastrolobium bilobum]|uniref:aspartic proteinase CDR1-like n=1 Tax=Gastrolobium bilobum TaxID=150636 RepID=UPI002AAFE2FA|nr:aspartic proteinase CDR1-like [Gastrolobium bilobum]